MPATQPGKELRALCHEHHVEMRLNQSLVNSTGKLQQTLAYACTEPDCLVHYNIFRGYFMLAQNENMNQMDRFPESDVRTMGHPCISLKSIWRKGFSPVEMPAMPTGGARMRRAS